MTEQRPENRRRERPSFIWPLILIAVGVLFLLNNVGVIQGDFWSMVWRWWPLLLVALGLDSLLRRNEIAGPVFLISLGLVFFVGNVGLIGWGIWGTLWRLWPIILIAVGIEIILRRRSLWVSSLVVTLIVFALGAVLWAFRVDAPTGELLQMKVVNQPLGEIEFAELDIRLAAGKLTIDRLVDSTALIYGDTSSQGRSNIYTDYQVRGKQGYFRMDSQPLNNFPSMGSWEWDLGITDRIPLKMSVAIGAGDIDLDFTGVSLSKMDISQGVGEITVILQESGNYEVRINQAIGSIDVILPGDTSVRVDVDRAISNLDIPVGFEQRGDYYYSPGYEDAESKIDLTISQAIGNVEIRY